MRPTKKAFNTNKYTSNYKHGFEDTRLYHIWSLIKQRCNNPKNKDYYNYGGRGIIICNEWLEFIPFMEWSLNHGYADNLEIDRIDNNGNYEPTNCHFVTTKENTRNRRTTKLNMQIANEIRELYKTGDYTQKQIAKKFNISFGHVSDIINKERWG